MNFFKLIPVITLMVGFATPSFAQPAGGAAPKMDAATEKADATKAHDGAEAKEDGKKHCKDCKDKKKCKECAKKGEKCKDCTKGKKCKKHCKMHEKDGKKGDHEHEEQDADTKAAETKE